jgi:hypothetical protein
MAEAPGLFGLDVPAGFQYREDFVSGSDERVLVDAMAGVAFSDFEMRGVVARRRVAFFGQSYDQTAAGPFPEFLLPLRARIAQWAGVDPEAFAMALAECDVHTRCASPASSDTPIGARARPHVSPIDEEIAAVSVQEIGMGGTSSGMPRGARFPRRCRTGVRPGVSGSDCRFRRRPPSSRKI